jgi:predicted permease
VAVISYGFCQRWFHGVTDVVGRQFEIEGSARDGRTLLTVVGVMPQGFYFPDQQTELWTPATLYWRFDRESVEYFPDWARRWTAVARVRPGASLAEARADLARVGRQQTADHPTSDPNFPGFATTVVPVFDTIVGQSLQSTLWILLGAVGLVLVIACVNVANLLLARGATRQQEFAVRRALGGGKGKLARQLVTESIVLAVIAGIVGTVVSLWATRILGVAAQSYVPRIGAIEVDWRVLTFALLMSLGAGIAFGVIPALRLSGTDASESLREASHSTGRARSKRSRELLVALESAIAIVLLVGAGLLLRSLDRVRAVDPGFDPRNVLTMRLEFASEPPPNAEERTQTSSLAQSRATRREAAMDELLIRLRSIPNVQAAGFIDDLYLNSPGNETITIPGRTDQGTGGELNQGYVTPGMFESLRVPLRRGRYLTRLDAAQKIRALWSPVITDLPLEEKERRAVPEPVVVNEAFVQRFFPNEEALGKRFCIDPTNKTYWYEIVGVVGDLHRHGLERAAIPQYYGPYFPSPNARADLLIRTAGDPVTLAESFRAEVSRALPGVTIVTVSTAAAGLDAFSGLRRLQTLLLTTFAILAVLLAAVGIFGLVHYAVAARTREIGVRVALGATPAKVLGMVLMQGLRAPVVGIAVGLAASLLLTRVLASLLFGIGATDPVTFAGVSTVLIGVSVAAGYSAGRAAVRIDPLSALRVS